MPSLSIVIPTYGRGGVLCETIEALQAQQPTASEILVIDQTPAHEKAVARQLQDWADLGRIHWIKQQPPSITRAMNRGLCEASGELVLFLDDDIIPGSGLVKAHRDAFATHDVTAVTGQVLQPGETPEEKTYRGPNGGLRAYLDFPFYSIKSAWIINVMAGNLSVNREQALALGGFDENFAGVAYRFETDFARRIHEAGGRILFLPEASIQHLRSPQGGTRIRGSHLTSASGDHGMGDYYYALRHGRGGEGWIYMARRPLREVCTRFHLRHPWWIPVKLAGECRAFFQALARYRKGPSLLLKADTIRP